MEDMLDLSLNIPAISANQLRGELRALALFVQEMKVGKMLEIGTNKGGTFFMLCQMARPDATVISLDIPGGLFGEKDSWFREAALRRMTQKTQKYHRLLLNSHSTESLEKVTRILNGEKLDFLFIDGDHRYEGVKMDFEMYSPLVRPGGVVGFHDVGENSPAEGCAVDRFWSEIKFSYEHREIVAAPGKGYGIGLLYV